MTDLCLAYGSNTNAADWSAWCAKHGFDAASVVPVGTAILPDRRLAFDRYSIGRRGGVLDVLDRRGGYVQGVLLRVREREGWDALDAKEGAPIYYERVRRTAILPGGAAVPVITYEVTPRQRGDFRAPHDDYLNVVRRGYAAHGLDVSILEAAADAREGCHLLTDVFVYGTLMTGEANHHVAAGAGIAWAVPATLGFGRMHHLGDYPALVLEAGGAVRGELLSFRDIAAALDDLDRLEEARPWCEPGGFYRRTIVDVTDDGGRQRQAWCYVMDPSGPQGTPVIRSGNWRERGSRSRMRPT